jgi:hypothetical protein
MMEHQIPPSWTAWEDPARVALQLHAKKPSLPALDGRESLALWDISSGCILWLPPKTFISPDALQKSQDLLDSHPGMFDHPALVLDVKVSGPGDAVVSFLLMRSKRPRRRQYLRIAHFSTDAPVHGSSSWVESSDRSSAGLSSSSNFSDAVSIEESGSRIKSVETSSPLSFGSQDNKEQDTLLQNNDHLLYLEKTSRHRSMVRHSFVDISVKYEIEWQELRCYARGQKPDGWRFRLDQPSFQKVVEKAICPVESTEWIETGKLWETFIRRHIKDDKLPHADQQ